MCSMLEPNHFIFYSYSAFLHKIKCIYYKLINKYSNYKNFSLFSLKMYFKNKLIDNDHYLLLTIVMQNEKYKYTFSIIPTSNYIVF